MSELKGYSQIGIGTDRNFGIVFGVVFAIIGAWPLKDGGAPRLWALAIAAVFLAVALTGPRLLHPFNLLWFKFGMWLGSMVAPIVMSLLFFLVVTPTGMIVRAMGKDLLRLKIDKGAESYWIERDEETDPMGSMKNQF